MKLPYQSGHSQSHNRKQIGQGLVEFSLILPMLLFLLLGILDYGRILLVYSNASSSVRNAARQGTLVGTVTDAQMGPDTQRYMACATIDDFAQNVYGANVNSVDILYFNTREKTSAERDAIETALNALDPTTLATLDPADYDCADDTINGPRNRNPDISAGAIQTGDLMVILLSARIDFITPLLSSVFPSFEITFRAQRTLVESLVLNVEGDDLDGDGLLDRWEFERFGCILENTEDLNNPVFLLPDTSIARRVGLSWAYVQAGYSNSPATEPIAQTPPPGTPAASGYSIPNDCARDNLSQSLFDDPTQYDYLDCTTPDPDPTDDILEDCIIIATGLFSSTSDPDNDGCNNGCEEARGTKPIDTLTGFAASDSDGDGLSDAAEIGTGTDPNDDDSDDDGLLDGQERCEVINDVDPTICDSVPSGLTWSDTNPLSSDTDNDGLDDFSEFSGGITLPNDGDTDNDGLDDGTETNGFVIDLEINGVIFTTGTIFTDPSASGGDTDGDGIGDGDEVNGYSITNAIDGTITVKSHPADADTDDDGVCDGDGTGGSCSGVADVNPTRSDTDSDGLTDGEEQLTYNTVADNINSDADACDLDDGFEMLGDQSMASFTAYGDYDFDADGDVNAMDLDSDGDGITDCDEVNIYGSNPYDNNSDGLDSFTDDQEVDPANWCLEIMRDDSAETLPCGGAGGGTDSDVDGLPDAWELLYFPDLSNDASADNDSDGCNNQCELDRRTDPNDPDTDNDGINDGLETGSNPLIRDTDNDGLIDGFESSDTCLDLVSLNDMDAPLPPPSPPYTDANCYATNPLLTDSDLDGLLDGAELIDMFVDINGVSNTPVGTTDPTDPDTDNDGLLDGEEINGVLVNTVINGSAVAPVIRSNPNSTDSDGDGVQDYLESKVYNIFANDSDTDDDMVQDGSTVGTLGELPNSFDNSLSYYDTNPREEDTDNDGLLDRAEIDGFNISVTTYDAGGTPTTVNPTAIAGYDIGNPFSTTNLSPRISDTDGDGLSDGDEVNVGDVTNPTLANTDGDTDAGGNPIVDGADNCPIHVNSNQQDLDTDGIGSVCDASEAATTVYVDPITDASNLVDATNWTPSVVVRAVNTLNQVQSGVNITVTFTDPNNGGATVGTAQTCTTNASGECTVDIGSRSQATFPDLDVAVTNLTNEPVGLTYTPASNDGPIAISVPPLSVHVETIAGSNSGTPSAWEAFATVTVHDDFGATVNGVDVEVTFTDNDGTVSVEVCTTSGAGQCQVSTGVASLDSTDPTATATITDITNLGGYGYDDTSNAAPEVINAPSLDVHVSAISGSSTGDTSDWEASATVTVIDEDSNTVNGVDVNVEFFNAGGTVATDTCTTTGAGQCVVQTPNSALDGADANVTVTITSITNLGAYGYDAASDVADVVINPPAPVGSITAQIRINNDSANQSGVHYQITNTSASAITNIRVRVYFTTDAGRPASQYVLDRDYESSGNPQTSPTGPFLHSGNIYYFEINYGTKSLAAGATWLYQWRLHLSSYNNDYDAANDWWYTGITSSYADTAYLPVYINGVLETGNEP